MTFSRKSQIPVLHCHVTKKCSRCNRPKLPSSEVKTRKTTLQPQTNKTRNDFCYISKIPKFDSTATQSFEKHSLSSSTFQPSKLQLQTIQEENQITTKGEVSAAKSKCNLSKECEKLKQDDGIIDTRIRSVWASRSAKQLTCINVRLKTKTSKLSVKNDELCSQNIISEQGENAKFHKQISEDNDKKFKISKIPSEITSSKMAAIDPFIETYESEIKLQPLAIISEPSNLEENQVNQKTIEDLSCLNRAEEPADDSSFYCTANNSPRSFLYQPELKTFSTTIPQNTLKTIKDFSEITNSAVVKTSNTQQQTNGFRKRPVPLPRSKLMVTLKQNTVVNDNDKINLDQNIMELLNLYPKCFDNEFNSRTIIQDSRHSIESQILTKLMSPKVDESIFLAYEALENIWNRNSTNQNSQPSLMISTPTQPNKWIRSLPNILFLLKWLKREYKKLETDRSGDYSKEVLDFRRGLLDCLSELLEKKCKISDIENNSEVFKSLKNEIRMENDIELQPSPKLNLKSAIPKKVKSSEQNKIETSKELGNLLPKQNTSTIKLTPMYMFSNHSFTNSTLSTYTILDSRRPKKHAKDKKNCTICNDLTLTIRANFGRINSVTSLYEPNSTFRIARTLFVNPNVSKGFSSFRTILPPTIHNHEFVVGHVKTYQKKVRIDPNTPEPQTYPRRIHSNTNGRLLKLESLRTSPHDNSTEDLISEYFKKYRDDSHKTSLAINRYNQVLDNFKSVTRSRSGGSIQKTSNINSLPKKMAHHLEFLTRYRKCSCDRKVECREKKSIRTKKHKSKLNINENNKNLEDVQVYVQAENPESNITQELNSPAKTNSKTSKSGTPNPNKKSNKFKTLKTGKRINKENGNLDSLNVPKPLGNKDKSSKDRNEERNGSKLSMNNPKLNKPVSDKKVNYMNESDSWTPCPAMESVRPKSKYTTSNNDQNNDFFHSEDNTKPEGNDLENVQHGPSFESKKSKKLSKRNTSKALIEEDFPDDNKTNGAKKWFGLRKSRKINEQNRNKQSKHLKNKTSPTEEQIPFSVILNSEQSIKVCPSKDNPCRCSDAAEQRVLNNMRLFLKEKQFDRKAPKKLCNTNTCQMRLQSGAPEQIFCCDCSAEKHICSSSFKNSQCQRNWNSGSFSSVLENVEYLNRIRNKQFGRVVNNSDVVSCPIIDFHKSKWETVMDMAQESVELLHRKLVRSTCAKSVRYAFARIFDYDEFSMVEITKSNSKPPCTTTLLEPRIIFTVEKVTDTQF